MENNPFIYELSKTIEYTKDGDFSKTATIELVGPTMSQFDLSSQLSQLVTCAILDAQDMYQKFKNIETDKDSSVGEVDEKAIKMILMSSKSISFVDIASVCENLFVKVGTYDGKTPLKKSALKSITIDDFTNMICGYIANFIFPSLF